MDDVLREAARLLRADPSLIGDFLERSGIKKDVLKLAADAIDTRHAIVTHNNGDGTYRVRYNVGSGKPLDVREANGAPGVPPGTWVFLVHTVNGWVFHLPLA